METTVEHEVQRIIVNVSGDVDLASADQLKETLDEVLTGSPQHVIIDMTPVTFMDSTGLGVLVRALKRAREAGTRLDLVISHERVLKVLAITQLDTVLSIHPSIDAVPV